MCLLTLTGEQAKKDAYSLIRISFFCNEVLSFAFCIPLLWHFHYRKEMDAKDNLLQPRN